MKLFVFTLAALLATTNAGRPATVGPQEKRELNFAATDKQLQYATAAPQGIAYATSAPSLGKVGPQSFAPKAQGGQELAYNPQSLSFNPQAINFLPQAVKYAPAPPHVTFGFAPQPQQQIEYAAQPVAYAPQQVAKAAPGPGAARLAEYADNELQRSYLEAYSSAPQQLPAASAINFSPASEVSSFKFSSPLVTYSNLGVLTQVTGKAATAAATAQHQAASAQQQAASAQQQAAPQQAPQFAYAQAPQRIAYAPAPAQQQISYQAAPQYTFAPQKVAYAQAPQQLAYAQAPQQLAYSGAPQKVVYAAQSAAPQPKVVYAQAPQQYLAASSNPQQVAYSSPQQVAYAGPSQQQLAYAFAAAAQGGHSVAQGAHSVPQPAYALPRQLQYEVPVSKYASSGNVYAQ